MDWKKTQIFLAVLLVAVNIFFAVILISQNNIKTYDSKTLDLMVQLLAESGISIDKQLLYTQEIDLDIHKTDIVQDYYSIVLSKFKTDEKYESFLIPGGFCFLFENGDSLEISDNYDILFKNANYENNIANKKKENIQNETAKNIIQKYFSIQNGKYDYGFEIKSIIDIAPGTEIVFIQTINGFSIHENAIRCVFYDGKILYVEGRWCFLPINEIISSQTYDLVNILLNEKNSIDQAKKETDNEKNDALHPSQGNSSSLTSNLTGIETTKDTEKPVIQKSITKLEQCFCSYKNGKDSALFYLPSWKITYDTGEVSIYNAISGIKY